MKKTMFVVALAIALVALSSVAAFGLGYAVDTLNADQTLHGGYGAATHACKQCHDVHGRANAADAPLWRWATKQAGCEACHLGAGGLATTARVYAAGGSEAEHTLGVTAVPDGSSDLGVGLACYDCHDAGPHGHNEGNDWGNSGGLITEAMGGTVIGYCGSCHDLNDRVGEATSHPFLADVSASTIAATPAADCLACHATQMDDGFPHQSATDYAFLGSATAAANANLDSVCLGCHPNVGVTF